MNMMTRPEGTFVIAWSQTEVDGLTGAPVSSLERGATWQWSGEPVRIDGASALADFESDDSSEALRRRAAAGARKLIGRALLQEGVRTPFTEAMTDLDRSFSVSDGRHTWVATLIDIPEIARPLLMFTGEMPPAGAGLYIVDEPEAGGRPHLLREGAEGVVCFTPGTRLDTPDGPRMVEDLVAGDVVSTKDDGAQEILWIGERHVSGARLYAMPDLRPVRIRSGALGEERPDGDLIVSPDHRMLVEGPAALALWGEKEVLVAARDLIDDHRIIRDLRVRSVTYIHLMLPRHGVLFANGMETESFHPAATSLDAIAGDQLARLFDVMPDLEITPSAYGPMSRRVLGRAEAALIRRAT